MIRDAVLLAVTEKTRTQQKYVCDMNLLAMQCATSLAKVEYWMKAYDTFSDIILEYNKFEENV